MCSLMMISDMLSKHVGAVKSVLKKWFKINDIQLVHLLVVWYLVNCRVYKITLQCPNLTHLGINEFNSRFIKYISARNTQAKNWRKNSDTFFSRFLFRTDSSITHPLIHEYEALPKNTRRCLTQATNTPFPVPSKSILTSFDTISSNMNHWKRR